VLLGVVVTEAVSVLARRAAERIAATNGELNLNDALLVLLQREAISGAMATFDEDENGTTRAILRSRQLDALRLAGYGARPVAVSIRGLAASCVIALPLAVGLA
jgi:hypothetical protein